MERTQRNVSTVVLEESVVHSILTTNGTNTETERDVTTACVGQVSLFCFVFVFTLY